MSFHYDLSNSNIVYTIFRAYNLYSLLYKINSYISIRADFLREPSISYAFSDENQKLVFLKQQQGLLSIVIFLFLDEYFFAISNLLRNLELGLDSLKNVSKLFFQEFIKSKNYNLKDTIYLNKLQERENEYAIKFVFEEAETKQDFIPELTLKGFNPTVYLISELDNRKEIKKASYSFLAYDDIKKQLIKRTSQINPYLNNFSTYLYYLTLNKNIYIEVAFTITSSSGIAIQGNRYSGISFIFKDYHFTNASNDVIYLISSFSDYDEIIRRSSFLEDLVNRNRLVMSDFANSLLLKL